MGADETSGTGGGLRAPDALLPLVERARLGDRAALEKLLCAVLPRVARVVAATLGPGAPEFDDVTQECLVQIMHAVRTFRGESSFAHYAGGISVRVALRNRKRKHRYQAQMNELAREQGDEIDPSPGPELGLRQQAFFRLVMEELPEAQAETLALRFILGLTLEEVAEATGSPVNTVRSRLRLAREALLRRFRATPRVLAELLGREAP